MVTKLVVEITLWDNDDRKAAALVEKIRHDARVLGVEVISEGGK